MKTICIYHRVDLDGWMSAAIVKHWYLNPDNKQGQSVCDYGNPTRTNNRMDMLGWNYGDSIPNLLEYDKVIMCDISFSVDKMFELYTDFGINFSWVDHHISAIKSVKERLGAELISGIRTDEFSACELTWKYFFPHESMPEIVRLLGLYDSFRHKGTNEEQKVLEFQYGARESIEDYEDAYDALCNDIDHGVTVQIRREGRFIYNYLCTEATQTYKKGFEIEMKERVSFGMEDAWIPRKFICFNKERFNPVNFGIDYHKDGYDGAVCFWYQDGKWMFSIYNDNGKVDCSVIAKQYGGGGHKGAAGFIVDDLSVIL